MYTERSWQGCIQMDLISCSHEAYSWITLSWTTYSWITISWTTTRSNIHTYCREKIARDVNQSLSVDVFKFPFLTSNYSTARGRHNGAGLISKKKEKNVRRPFRQQKSRWFGNAQWNNMSTRMIMILFDCYHCCK